MAVTTCRLETSSCRLLACRVACAMYPFVHEHPRLSPPLVELARGGSVPECRKQIGQAGHCGLALIMATNTVDEECVVPLPLRIFPLALAARGRLAAGGQAGMHGMPSDEEHGPLPAMAGLPLPPVASFPIHGVRCFASFFVRQNCGCKNLSSVGNGLLRHSHEPWISRTSPLCF